jgi:threonine aldolase
LAERSQILEIGQIIVGAEAHMVWHESGASSANSGVQFTVAGQGGTFDEVAFRNATRIRLCPGWSSALD